MVMIWPVERFFTKERTQQLCKIIFWLLLLVLVWYARYVIPYLLAEDIDVENIPSIISAIADIAVAAITALLFYIAYKTLVEMEKQRNIADTPRLHVTSSNIRISMEEINGYNIPIIWKSTKNPYEKNGNNIVMERNLDFLEPIKIVNTGLSPALDVEIKWKLEDEYIEKMSKRFNELFPTIKYEVTRSNEIYKMIFLYRTSVFTAESINEYCECVLSCSTKEDNKIELHIPRQLYILKFIELCVLYAEKSSDASLDSPLSKISIPIEPLIADISYSDNINSNHQGKLHVNLKIAVSKDKNNHEDILFKEGTLILKSKIEYKSTIIN